MNRDRVREETVCPKCLAPRMGPCRSVSGRYQGLMLIGQQNHNERTRLWKYEHADEVELAEIEKLRKQLLASQKEEA